MDNYYQTNYLRSCLCSVLQESFHRSPSQGEGVPPRFRGCLGGTSGDSTFFLTFDNFTFREKFTPDVFFSKLDVGVEPTVTQHSYFWCWMFKWDQCQLNIFFSLFFWSFAFGLKSRFNLPHHFCFYHTSRLNANIISLFPPLPSSTILVKEKPPWHCWSR